MKRFSALLVIVGVAAFPLSATAQSVTVIVNGQTMTFTQPPIERTGRVFVPLRGIFEQLGASVVYAHGQINATAHGRTVSLTIGSTQSLVNGQPEVLDIAPFIVGATTFVPLRFISQALGAAVNWNNATSTVTINSGAPVGVAPHPVPAAVSLVNQTPVGTIYNPTRRIHFSINRPVNFNHVEVRVDGRNVTQFTRPGGHGFVVVLPYPLAGGLHRVRVTGNTAGGIPFDLSWTFVQGR
jgi:Copper amine oxidase N-terminal domain